MVGTMGEIDDLAETLSDHKFEDNNVRQFTHAGVPYNPFYRAVTLFKGTRHVSGDDESRDAPFVSLWTVSQESAGRSGEEDRLLAGKDGVDWNDLEWYPILS